MFELNNAYILSFIDRGSSRALWSEIDNWVLSVSLWEVVRLGHWMVRGRVGARLDVLAYSRQVMYLPEEW
jgi:hypothetical protein